MRQIAIFLVIALVFLLSTRIVFAQTEVVINEVYYDPQGADSTLEFLELYNSSDNDICIGAWDVQTAGPSFSIVLTIPENVAIKAKGYYLIGGQSNVGNFGVTADLIDDSLVMQNGGSESDGARIRDEDNNVVDTVLYDEPNSNNLPDDTGVSGISLAVDVSEGHSLERTSPGSDSNQSAVDFADKTAPTPRGGDKTTCPSPSPSPTPTPTPSPSPSPTPVKSPTPTPKASPIQTVLTPSPTAKKSAQILGVESTNQATSQSTLTKSPTPVPKVGSSKTKIAAMLTGSGALLIGLSFGFYLWYKRALTPPKDQEKNQDQ